MVATTDRPPAEPETVWGACRALLQAGAGAAFVLEGRPLIGTLLLVVAAATAVYETVRWWGWSRGLSREGAAESRTVRGEPRTGRPGTAATSARGRATRRVGSPRRPDRAVVRSGRVRVSRPASRRT